MNPAIVLELPSALPDPPILEDDTLLRSINWSEGAPWKQENVNIKQNDKYEICMQLGDYTPEEISVKTFDGFIVVEGKHEEKKDDYGYVAKQFVRKFQIPEGYKIEEAQSRLTGNGLFVVSVPQVEKKDTVIPVKHEVTKSKL